MPGVKAIKGAQEIAEMALSFMQRDKMPPTEAIRTASYLEGVPMRSGKELDALEQPLAKGTLDNPFEAILKRYHNSVAPWYGKGAEGDPLNRAINGPAMSFRQARQQNLPTFMAGDVQDDVRSAAGSKYLLNQLIDLASGGDEMRRLTLLKTLGFPENF